MSSGIEVDEGLMNKALEVSGLPARETVEKGLRLLIQLRALGAIRGLFGKIPLDGDLETLRYGGTSCLGLQLTLKEVYDGVEMPASGISEPDAPDCEVA